jgi:tetratricopeptide (TPR) repeat protein
MQYKEYIDQGHKFLKQGAFEQAAATYKKAVELKPQELPGYINLGSLLAKIGNLEEATAILKQAIQQAPNQAIAYVSLASLYLKHGDLSNAQPLFTKAIELDKNQPLWVYYNAGIPASDIIDFQEYKIAYIPIPKCASSTLKSIFYKLKTGEDTINPHPFYNNPFFKTQNRNIETYQDYFKFVIIRDPIKRFISYYYKNIMGDQSLQNHFGCQRFAFNLDCLPDINFFIEHLEDYIYAFIDVRHHTLCQSAYITDLNQYDFVCDIGNLENLTNNLNEIVGQNLTFSTLMKSKKNVSTVFYDMSLKSLHKLISYYEEDYKLLKDYYSPDTILSEYKSWLLDSL